MRIARLVVTIALTCAASVAHADVALTAHQQAIVERLQAQASERSRSSDLRLRIMYSVDGATDDERRPASGGYAAEIVSAAELYEQARGSTDPLVLDLLSRRCQVQTKTMDRCDRLALARRWTEVDTQNQIAWLTLAAAQKENNDLDAARFAFQRAARASVWHEHYGDVARLIARTIPTAAPPEERYGALVEALAKANHGSPINALQTLWGFCKDDDPAMRDACGRIVQTMARDSETILSMTMAIRYAVKAKLDPTLITAYQRRVDAFQWIAPSVFGTVSVFEMPDEATSKTHAVLLATLIDKGERQRSEDVLREQGLTEGEAARRRVASLSAAESNRRADILAGR